MANRARLLSSSPTHPPLKRIASRRITNLGRIWTSLRGYLRALCRVPFLLEVELGGQGQKRTSVGGVANFRSLVSPSPAQTQNAQFKPSSLAQHEV